MSVLLRNGPVRAFSTLRGLGAATATAALALGGCSANLARFDNPSFALGEGAGGTAPRRTAGGPVLDTPAALPAQQPQTTPPGRARGMDVAGLSGPEPQSTLGNASEAPRAMAVTRSPTPPVTQPPGVPLARGQQIEVQQGDTLYAISKRHKVLISDLMAANGLSNPNLKPGQKLYLPLGSLGRPVPQIRPERAAIARPGPQSPPQADSAQATPSQAPIAEAAPASPATGDTYTVKPGDSLYAIAARHRIKLLDLQRANDITDVRKVKPGMVLKLPTGGGVVASAPARQVGTGETVQPETRIVRIGSQSGAPPGVKLLNGGDQPARVAAAEPAATTTDAGPGAPASAGGLSAKLRWPVRGRVVQGFGPRADGSHNDGVDIAVPAGTDVLAAESGVVAYAGSEVKTYGNLVLIRHDNGWVTAYAYNEKLLVQRGDRVKRGQPVAKAGKTGAADQPQVHFEVRVGSKPVDPTGYLERM